MTNVEKLKKLGILNDLRERLGGGDCDEELNAMSPQRLMEEWAGWQLGDPYWATFIIETYEKLKEIEKN